MFDKLINISLKLTNLTNKKTVILQKDGKIDHLLNQRLKKGHLLQLHILKPRWRLELH